MSEIQEAVQGWYTDPRWWAAIITLAGLIITLTIAHFNKAKKRLQYEVVSYTRLTTIHEAAGDRIAITFDGKPVSAVVLVSVSVANTGNQPLLEADFTTPLSMNLTDGKILSAEVTERSPNGLPVNISIVDASLKVDPLLLNPKDSFIVHLLADGGNAGVDVQGRIVGAPILRMARRHRNGILKPIAFGAAGCAGVLVANMIAAYVTEMTKALAVALLIVAVVGMGLVIFSDTGQKNN